MKVERAIAETFYVNDLSEISTKTKLPMLNGTSKDNLMDANLHVSKMNKKESFSFKDLKIWHEDCGEGAISIVGLHNNDFRLVCQRCAASWIIICPKQSIVFLQVAVGILCFDRISIYTNRKKTSEIYLIISPK